MSTLLLLTSNHRRSSSPIDEFGPSNSALAAWCRTNKLVYQDAAKTVLATSHLDPVRVVVWPNGPLGAVEWTAPSDSARPLLYNDTGDKWSFLFDGIDDRLTTTTSSLFHSNSDSCVGTAYRGLAASAKGTFWKDGSDSDGYGCGVGDTDFDGVGPNLIAIREGKAWVGQLLAHQQQGCSIAISASQGSDLYNLAYYRDNVAGSTVSNALIDPPTTGASIGAYFGGTRPCSFRVPGLVALPYVPTSTQRASLNTILLAL